MSSDEITRAVSGKLSIIRDILNSQYGAIGFLVALFWVVGSLSPTEYDQATHFVAHTIVQLNNPVGICILVLLILVYINKSFFQKYLEKENRYTSAYKDFEGAMKGFATQCSVIQASRRNDDSTLAERLGNIESDVTRLMSDMSEHMHETSRIIDTVNMQIHPSVKKIHEFIEDK